jgi:hypothetical protein
MRRFFIKRHLALERDLRFQNHSLSSLQSSVLIVSQEGPHPHQLEENEEFGVFFRIGIRGEASTPEFIEPFGLFFFPDFLQIEALAAVSAAMLYKKVACKGIGLQVRMG